MKKIILCLLALCLLCACGSQTTPDRQPVAPVAPPMEPQPQQPGQTAPPPGPSEGPGAPIQITPTVPGGETGEPGDQPIPPTPADENLCSLTIRCDTLVGNADLDPEKVELVPADGLLAAFEGVAFEPGESVFNVLQRTLKQNKLHLEFSTTPLYNTAYIEGVCNLYQFDAGSLSGWMYQVNGDFPLTGCSNTTVQPGDQIVWHFTCDLGADLGVEGFTGYVD